MKRVSLDTAADAVKQFVRDLPVEEGVELELGGQVVCEVLPPHAFSAIEREAVLARGRALVERVRERNRGVPARVLAREIREAVDEVRRRKSP